LSIPILIGSLQNKRNPASAPQRGYPPAAGPEQRQALFEASAERRRVWLFFSYFLGAKSRQKRLPAWRRITPAAWPRTPLGAPCFVCLRQTHFRARRRLSLPGGRSPQ